jgi:Na+-driven multidrug efflux pump
MDVTYVSAEGSLRGAGDTRWPLMMEMVLGWGFNSLRPIFWGSFSKADCWARGMALRSTLSF